MADKFSNLLYFIFESVNDRTHILHSFHSLLHLSCNKSTNLLVLNVYFVEDNHGEKED